MTAASSVAGNPAEGEPAFDARFMGPIYPAPGHEHTRRERLYARLAARAPRWSAPAAIAACFASAAAYVWVSNPTDGGAADIPTCLVKLTTGLDCPGCGGTRAFYYLLHGNIPQAVRYHAVAVFAAPFLLWLYVGYAVKKIWGKRIPMPRLSSGMVSAFIAAWALFMVVRNIPVAPFTSLYV